MLPAQVQTEPLGGVESLTKSRCRDLLAEARERTLALVEPVSERDMNRVHDPLMSPLVWDLGHIAAFEDLWLCQRAGGMEGLRPDLATVYDAAETPRCDRADVACLELEAALEFMDGVRERALEVLDEVDFSDARDRLNRRGTVWEMVVQHEHQHNETMLQTLALAEPGVFAPDRRPLPPGSSVPADGMVEVAAGPFLLGLEPGSFAYDNERPQHEVDLPAFAIDRTAVTNGAYLEFVEAGGYERPEWWSDEGWDWRRRVGIERPLYWTGEGLERSFDRIAPIDPLRPVMYVSWHEADAFARFRGKRLPTEAEWEKTASWDPGGGVKRRFPWGEDPSPEHANLDQLGFGPAPADAYANGASAYGALGMIGDGWEWTASDFDGYPGFRAFPYREYSEAFFGADYKVLRGGAWATRPRAVRSTFRNWDFPVRRQIHAGFRCAKDLD